MKDVRVLVVGLGSIGTRHARLLRSHFPDVSVVALRSGTRSRGNSLGVPEVHSWEEVEAGSFTAAVIANPTSMHIDTAMRCAQRGLHIFLEKPIDCRLGGLDDLLDVVEQRALTTYVAYPLRHHAVVRTLKSRLRDRAVLSACLVSASYLPDWRPGRDHLKGHSAQTAMGGGVLLEMSHELDLAHHLFGEVLAVEGALRRVGDVTVDAEDCADVLLTHAWGTTNVHLDMISRHPRRTIEVETADGFLMGDIRNQTVTDHHHGHNDEIALAMDPDDMYVRQLRYFLSRLGDTKLDNNLLQASRLYTMMIGLREEQGYGATHHDLRPGRVAGGQGQEHPPRARKAPDRVHD